MPALSFSPSPWPGGAAEPGSCRGRWALCRAWRLEGRSWRTRKGPGSLGAPPWVRLRAGIQGSSLPGAAGWDPVLGPQCMWGARELALGGPRRLFL